MRRPSSSRNVGASFPPGRPKENYRGQRATRSQKRGGLKLGGHNFGVLLPWWEMLFGTVNFEQRYEPTGVRDQVENNRDYGRGFWSRQWLGVRRLLGRA